MKIRSRQQVTVSEEVWQKWKQNNKQLKAYRRVTDWLALLWVLGTLVSLFWLFEYVVIVMSAAYIPLWVFWEYRSINGDWAHLQGRKKIAEAIPHCYVEPDTAVMYEVDGEYVLQGTVRG